MENGQLHCALENRGRLCGEAVWELHREVRERHPTENSH